MKKLAIHQMSFKFDKEQDYFFHNINLNFETGKIYFIQGKNGIGKSTFFSILQGNIPHNALLTGSIIFDTMQYTIKNNTMDLRLCAHIKTMVQDPNKMIVNTMTVAENLQLAQLSLYPGIRKLTKQILFEPFINQLGIDIAMPIYRLSGGQKQIIAILMALQKPTKILLLDEPTAALDDKNSNLVMEFLNTLVKQLELIIIIITHDKELISEQSYHEVVTIEKKIDGTRILSFRQKDGS